MQLEGGSKKPMTLEDPELAKAFNPKKIKTPFDTAEPISVDDIKRVAKDAVHMSNPNTGDDVYRKQAIPAHMYRSGSSSSAPNAGHNIKTVFAGSSSASKYASPSSSSSSTSSASSSKKEEAKSSAAEEQIDMTKLKPDEFIKLIQETGELGADFFKHVQAVDGHIPGDYGGPMFLMPGAIIACYATGTHLPAQTRLEMIKYILAHQQTDGGYGLHIESNSTMFGTALNYVALRVLGCPKDLEPVARACAWIKKNGGAQGIPSWGKFWLAVMNVFPWEGCNSIFPELWLLPKGLPIHPWRYWCHCRMVYLPMAYIYGAKFQVPESPLVKELREELYVGKYAEMDFTKFRDSVASTDLYTDQSLALKIGNVFLNAYEKYFPKFLFRQKALDFILDYVSAEDKQTNYVDIGPVSKFINMLCCFHGYGKDSIQFRLHQSRINDYFWLAEDGIKCQGYNGSQLWDTAFTVQAFLELQDGVRDVAQKRGEAVKPRTEHIKNSPVNNFLENAYDYVEISQVRQEVDDREKYFRHVSLGGWPFSTRDHGWPISDCTAEGLKAAMYLHETGIIIPKRANYITPDRLQEAVNVILTMQNYQDGGWATYENTRGPAWLEALNPSEVFGGIMIDYSYVECSSACVQALLTFQRAQPNHRTKEVKKAIEDGVKFIKSIQRPDGSWVGSWAVCFTYAAWFGVEALTGVGEQYATSPALQKAASFLLSKQLKDGGWGESFLSCVTKQYSYSYNKSLIASTSTSSSEGKAAEPEPVSMVINTAWSVLALLACDYHKVDRKPIDRAMQFIMSRQLPNGDWPQEGISGVFNGNCMITYTAYRSLFPIWAIGRYLTKISEL